MNLSTIHTKKPPKSPKKITYLNVFFSEIERNELVRHFDNGFFFFFLGGGGGGGGGVKSSSSEFWILFIMRVMKYF